MALANLLAKDGHEVSVYEKNQMAGGRAGKLEKDGFTFDTGPSWYLMPKVFEKYFELIGENINNHLKLIKLEPGYKVFFEDDNPITITSDLSKDKETFESIESGAGEKLEEYVNKSDSVYQLAIKHFLYTDFRNKYQLLNRDVLLNSPKLFRLLGTPISKYTSRFVKDRRLKQILEYPMVFLGTSPFDAPAMYSLMSALDFKEGIYYPEGGMYKVVESLELIGKSNGVKYHFQNTVTKINDKNGSAKSVELSNGDTVDADIVISNADLYHTENTLLNKEARSYKESYWSKQKSSPSALLIYLGIKGKVPELQHHNLLFASDWKANFDTIYKTKNMPDVASLYICKPSQTDKSVAPEKDENIFILVPIPSGIDLSDDEAIRATDKYLKQIENMTGIDLTSRIVTKTIYSTKYFTEELNSWQASMLGPAHTLSQSALFRTTNKSKVLDNLYYVGAGTIPGIGVPMCLISAELAYRRIKGDA